MRDTAPFRHQRVRGRAACSVAAGRVRRLSQAGSAKAMLPSVFGGPPEVVFLNTAGGITGGDQLEFDLDIADGTVIGTTQTAERVYRAGDGVGLVRQRLEVGAGATALWLPQETILFDNAALDRVTEVTLGPGSVLVLLDILIFGRAAMGERISRLHLRDVRRVTRDNRPLLLEAVRLDAMPQGPAGLRGARAVASLSRLGPGSADLLDPVRAALPMEGVRAGASAWDDRLTIRAMASDGWPLRRLVARVLPVLTGRPLPRVWQI